MEKVDVLLHPLVNSKEYKDILESVKYGKGNILLNGLLEGQKSNLLHALYNDLDTQFMFLMGSDLDAKKMYERLQRFFKSKVLYLGSDEVFFYHLEAKDRKDEVRKLEPLLKLAKEENIILVTSVEAALKKYVPKDILKKSLLKFRVGQVVEIENVVDSLTNLGYERVSKVEGYGQFSVRGGIVDIFSLGSENPMRIEFFDDEIDSIRFFDVFTQKSIRTMKRVEVTPSRAFIFPKDITKGVKRLREETSKETDSAVINNIDKIERKEYFEGVDNYIGYLFDDEYTDLFSYFKDDRVIMIDDINRLREKAGNVSALFADSFKVNLDRGLALRGQADLVKTTNELLMRIGDRRAIVNSLLAKQVSHMNIKTIMNFRSREIPNYNGRLEVLAEDLKNLIYRGFKVVISASSFERAKKIANVLDEFSVSYTLSEDRNIEIKSSQIVVTVSPSKVGYLYDDLKYAFMTDYEIFGVKKLEDKKKKKKKKSKTLDPFIDLTAGDYVVHEANGIGRFVGIEQLKVNNVRKDYIKILYSGNDSLYVPIEQMDKVQKYIGGDVERVRLSKLGSSEWTKAKRKVKREIEDMTQELIDLYAKRESSKGYKFSKDTVWQAEFESQFMYEETQDQLNAIKDTKKDMESSKVMDRLICGDVGYGKTEVAIRAIFKAVMDGKQCAVLVPTTILAQQHYNTFFERFEGYPIRIEVMSRFKTPKEQAKIADDVRRGLVDVVIGTHRIVSKDIQFKNLGLVVVDEEQRFGVRHKEALKKIKSSVDVLTLSATPIPRTLHMSLSGIRDMSLLEEPPQERYPVITYVVESNDSIIQDEIEREIARGGQVFFVYNRVESIDEMASRIRRLVPDARVSVAHGRMSAKDLENIVFGFLNKEFDVMVCTTIIETGMDIANANTIMIYDADKMGLSQLYQLRGRVGRSTRQGYAFLIYEKDKVLSEVAEKRLKAIKEFTEFGSGFKVAMRDLEIRGAGNIVGSQQSGHMAAIGYELYVKMLNNAINKIKGISKEEEEIEPEIELSTDAFIPDSYIDDEISKIEMYKKIASIETMEDQLDVKDELIDRYGDIPRATDNLLSIAYIKAMCKTLKIEKISQKGDVFHLEPITTLTLSSKSSYTIIKELEEILELMIQNMNRKKEKESSKQDKKEKSK